jgi:hypothetical protein
VDSITRALSKERGPKNRRVDSTNPGETKTLRPVEPILLPVMLGSFFLGTLLGGRLIEVFKGRLLVAALKRATCEFHGTLPILDDVVGKPDYLIQKDEANPSSESENDRGRPPL